VFDLIDHVGIAVRNIDAALGTYQEKLGLKIVHRESIASFDVEAVLLEVGESHIELITPLRAESAVARFLDKKGEGLHHIAYRVSDIDQSLAELKRLGFALIDETPRAGICNSRVGFIHPSAFNGVLTELVQPAH
jgi:methylmalonyl-CoA/ethylmalonyl-CoA epimerase